MQVVDEVSKLPPTSVLVDKENGDYCVYHHKHDGEVFYVGMGNRLRPFKTESRSAYWTEFVSAIGKKHEIEIVKDFKKRSEALKYETEEINRLLPYVNILGIVNKSTHGGTGATWEYLVDSEEVRNKFKELKEHGLDYKRIVMELQEVKRSKQRAHQLFHGKNH